MRLRHLAGAAATAVALVGFSAIPAQADHSWGTYHWARSGELNVNVHSSVTSDWAGILATANNDWNKSQYLQNTVVTADTSSQTRRRCSMIPGAVRVCNYTYGRKGWSGLATINLSGGHISQASAKMNDTYMSVEPAVAKAHVMCQEIGHDWGLDHQDESGADLNTCMDYADAFDNPSPNQHDYDQLATIYSHSDGAAAASSGTTKIKTGNTVTMVTWAW